jgi:hypothetical protein
VPAAQILDAPNPFIPGEAERYGANGYAVIEIDGPRFVEEVRTPDGQVLLRQQLA